MTHEARPILENIIEDFEPEKFVLFFRRKSPRFSEAKEGLQHYNDENFAQARKLGEIEFADSERLIVCTLSMQKALTERSGKKAQYDKAKKILKEQQIYSAGIFIFYDDDGNFRFSLVYPEYAGTKKVWSNFRRFTYFVSREFTNKTFLQRLASRDDDFTTLNIVKEAFAIAPVTDFFYKEFFVEYDKLVQAVRKINKIDEDKARDFVLLFAIRTIFLGFIQKRKWLGGNEKFIQDFFQAYQKSKADNKFYEDWLTILFFEALNHKFTPRKHLPKEINDALILAPYLNGGLFKEKKDYDDNSWIIPDKEIESFFEFLFSHSFTIEESSLDDAELQLNPEFLGIIFERLVNKADGAVYTPRTEVDLMCRLSLVKWLMKNLSLPITPVNLYELFFREGEAEEDQKDGSFSPKEAKEILLLLERLAVCDPAVGSGAFVVGMMQVLDEIEQKLREKAHLPASDIFERKKQIISQSLYGVEVKEWAVWICQLRLWLSLFVDAPEGMRLSPMPILPSLDFKIRQGDSLVQRIGNKPFPVTGHAIINNSVKKKVTQLKNLKVEYFYNKSSVDEWEIRQRELAVFEEILRTEIEEKQQAKFNLKHQKRSETASLVGIEESKPKQFSMDFDKEKINELESQIAELMDQKRNIRKDKPLIWNIEFAEIFVEKEGFDIIIGNPPYVRQEEIADPTGKIKDKKDYKDYLQEMVRLDFKDDFPAKKKINAKSDLYTYFYIRALRLLNPRGIHTFICSNSWLDVGYGVWLQEFLLNRCPVELIIDNHAKRSFEAADVNTIISIIHAPQKKVKPQHRVKFVAFKKPFEEAIFTENLLEIEEADKVISNDIFRVYPITTKELLDAGTEYKNEEEKKLGAGKYEGDKWGGKYLRAPDIFFKVLEKGEKHIDFFENYFTGERYLNTGGADGFFILTNVTSGKNFYNVINDKIIKANIGSFSGQIETEFFKKLIKDQTKQDKRIEIQETDAWCLVINGDFKHKHITDYIKWGESHGYNQRSVTKNQKPWFKPTNQMKKGAEVLLPRSFNDVFVTHLNSKKWLSLRYYRLHPKKENVPELVAFLNTTLFWFLFEAMGNKNQGQGVLDFYMDDFLKMKIPIIINNNIKIAFNTIKTRQIKSIFEECGIDPKSNIPIEEQEPKPLPDRAELDKIVFDALGLTAEERKEVYRAVCRLVWNRISKAKSV
ncbi:MAG TPA: Eco57I restriction-modification methylase domain-containing protein [Candidatus Moranbacteria bacterium]|nr:Eco57I restriction-modification methylase domain-containing protein [Candidatus Moranbacteria bacterium]